LTRYTELTTDEQAAFERYLRRAAAKLAKEGEP